MLCYHVPIQTQTFTQKGASPTPVQCSLVCFVSLRLLSPHIVGRISHNNTSSPLCYLSLSIIQSFLIYFSAPGEASEDRDKISAVAVWLPEPGGDAPEDRTNSAVRTNAVLSACCATMMVPSEQPTTFETLCIWPNIWPDIWCCVEMMSHHSIHYKNKPTQGFFFFSRKCDPAFCTMQLMHFSHGKDIVIWCFIPSLSTAFMQNVSNFRKR